MSQRFSTLPEWLAWLETLHPKKIDMSLDRVTAVLDTLGLSDAPYEVVTVGGTNGKGSCVSILESIYRRAGYKVGAFTSPHLWRFNERIRIDGVDASDEQLMSLFEAIDAALGAVTLSYFESSAVAALLAFARARADVAVLEVGMGGRLDAVNALDADAGLIATIDIDHQEWLGPDRETIGREKAGIMRRGRPVAVGDRNPPASVGAHARDVGADLLLIGRDFDYSRGANGWSYAGGGVRHDDLPPVPFGGGDVQCANAASCIAVVERLRPALPVADAALRAGLRHARLRGRFERYVRGGVEWVFDVAHNPAAANVFVRNLATLPPAEHTLAVFAAMHDKDIAGVLAPFVRSVDRWFVTHADPERGAPVEQIFELARRVGVERAEASPDVAAAVASAVSAARPGDRVLVFGSFYTVAPAMAALGLYSTPSESGD